MEALLEPAAVVLLVASVFLAVQRNLWQYPVGIAATVLYTIVFWRSQLYSSALLNVFFTLAQFYGWWFWLWGDKGKRPPISSWSARMIALVCGAGLAIAALMGFAFWTLSDAALPFADAVIFGLSVAAQFLLDRKKIENWLVWGVVDLISVVVYAQQHLWLTTLLYAGLFVNVFWGWHEWRKAMRVEAAPA